RGRIITLPVAQSAAFERAIAAMLRQAPGCTFRDLGRRVRIRRRSRPDVPGSGSPPELTDCEDLFRRSRVEYLQRDVTRHERGLAGPRRHSAMEAIRNETTVTIECPRELLEQFAAALAAMEGPFEQREAWALALGNEL